MAVTDTKVIGDYTAAITIDGTTHFLLIQPGSSSTAYRKISRNVLLGITGAPVGTTDSQSLTSKTLDNTNTVTLKDTLFTLQDDGDTSKQARFQLSGITTATTRTYTLPNASSTLADIATAQTFTNKTLTAPVISGGSIDNSTITVNSIGEHTAANGVTIDGLNIKDSALNTNNSVPNNTLSNTGAFGSAWVWNSWVPTWTNFTPGNGTLAYAKYTQVGKLVVFRLRFILGTTSSVSGVITFSTPVTMNADYTGSDIPVPGMAYMQDTGTNMFTGSLAAGGTTTVGLYSLSSTTGIRNNTSSTVPYTFTNLDVLAVSGYFEAA